ncbi:MAG: DGQHR domain-containing protein [Bacteroidetes bacterium]|nr:DGQHR domain-containing protein [Bacteroidota bacterium]
MKSYDMAKTKKKPSTKKKKKPTKPNLSDKDKLRIRLQKKMNKDVSSFFKLMGFEYVRTVDKHKTFSGHKSEIDSAFIFENIIVLCEQGVGKDQDHEHLRKKNEYFEAILNDKTEFLSWIKNIGKDKFERFPKYSDNRYKIFYIYITNKQVEEEKREVYSKLKYIDDRILKYFLKIASCIKHTTRNEFYKYLKLDLKDIGPVTSKEEKEHIYSSVIMPEEVSGFPQGVYLASFVMTAKELLDCSYVFRKENWESEMGFYYQRLIEKKRIEEIRSFLLKQQRSFIDNIIVSLPDNIQFLTIGKNDEKTPININTIDSLDSKIKIQIPYKINSIGVIDGQHRIYGHYESADSNENAMSSLRDKRHLFVTGIYYDKTKFPIGDKRKFESQLFLEINSKQKKVSPQLLQYIESLQEPTSPIGLATAIVTKLNNRAPFKDLFNISPLDPTKTIKTPTIIKYGLQNLVEINSEKETLFKYWKGQDKNQLLTSNYTEEVLAEYIKYCTNNIAMYFSAIRESLPTHWNTNDDSKLLTVTSIVAFLHSFNVALTKYKGVKDVPFYKSKLVSLKINFTKGSFPYVSSQWPKMAEEISKCWTENKSK